MKLVTTARRCAVLATSILCLVEALAQPQAPASRPFGLEPGAYDVGFQLLETQDESRTVTGGAGSTPHARPVHRATPER